MALNKFSAVNKAKCTGFICAKYKGVTRHRGSPQNHMWHSKEHSRSATLQFCRGRVWKWCPTTWPKVNMFCFITKAIGLHMTYTILPP
eukprot:13779298-Ditylum_brightwellii.AAC.1